MWSEITTAFKYCFLPPRIIVSFAFAIIVGIFVQLYNLSIFWLIVIAFAFLLVGLQFKFWKSSLLLIIIVWSSYVYACLRQPRPDIHDLSQWAGHSVIFHCRVINVLSHGTQVIIAPEKMIFPDKVALTGQCILYVHNQTLEIKADDQLDIQAKIILPNEAHNNWEFDYSNYLRKQGIYCIASGKILIITKSTKNSFSRTFENMLTNWRVKIIAIHKKYAGIEEGSLLSSMVLGDRAVDLPDVLKQNFRNVGLSHVLAASGFNLTLVTTMTFWMICLFTRSTLIVNVASFLSIILFVSLAGLSPSVVRAALMCSLVLFSRIIWRSTYTPGLISFSLIMTIIACPNLITDIGLQLSYAATIGIVCLVTPIKIFLQSHGCNKWIAETISIVVVAQAFVLPIQLVYFWQIGLFFLPANLLIIPMVTAISVLGFFSSILAVLPIDILNIIAGQIDKLLSYPLKLMILIVNFLSSFDAARLYLGPPMPATVCLYYFCLIVLYFSINNKRWCLICSLAYVIALSTLMVRQALPPLSLVVLQKTTILLNNKHQALACGDLTNKESIRFLTYYGFCPKQVKLVGYQDKDGLKYCLLALDDCPVLVLNGGDNHAKIIDLVRKTHSKWIVVDSKDNSYNFLGLQALYRRKQSYKIVIQ